MVAPLSPEQARLAAIREALPATAAGIYLNAAAAGPLPAETARVMAELATSELTLGRAHPQDPLDTVERIGEARAALAAVLGADLPSVALTRGIDHGLALAIAAVRAASVLVVRDAADAAPAWPAAGSAVVSVAPDQPDATVVDLVAQAFREPARTPAAVIVPLVAPWTGRRLPVEQIAETAGYHGAKVIVDGGCSVGALPVDVRSLGADALVFPAERWLLGPAGLGGLWGAPGMLDRLRTLHPVGFADGFTPGVVDAEWLAPAASFPRPAITGLARSAGWLAMQVGLPWAWERTARLVASTAEALRTIPGVRLAAPSAERGPVLTFSVDGWSGEQMLEELGARVFVLAAPCLPLDGVRISLGGWTTDDELDRLIGGVALLAAHTPATIPPRRTLNVLP